MFERGSAFVRKELGPMGTRHIRLGFLLTAAVTAWALPAKGQDYYPPDPQLPFPLYSTRPDAGGFYSWGEFMFFRQTNPLKNERIAQRGLVDFDGSITAALGSNVVFPNNVPSVVIPPVPHPGIFIGSGNTALSSEDAHGPQTYEPGFRFGLGWRFRDGVAVEASWMHLFEARYTAIATLVPPNLQAGEVLEETFLFSPVFNFPSDFAGPANKLRVGNPLAAFGIWNGASVMTLDFLQRFDQFDITGRIPLYETDCSRCYGLIGPRLVWFWERFKWRTIDVDVNGAQPDGGADSAVYTNIVSNRLYGVHLGGGDEFRLCDTPIGTFSVSLDLQAALFADIVKERAKYERGDGETTSKRSRTEYKFVPELEGQVNFWWYPVEGIQVRVGYDANAFFNTVSSPYPVDFNYGRVDPGWKDGTFRFLDGITAGVGFIF
jgi:hypothetical protein